MNPVIRRRLPPSVRSLLTDIGPKEEWTDADSDPEPNTKDGILLPSRCEPQEGFLTPAKLQDDGSDQGRSAVCMLCHRKPSCYTCPRCNLQYCGLSCYQSPDHSTCSEEFYKDSVMQELKEMGKTEADARKKMQQILLGLKQKAEVTDGGLERLLREEGIVGDDDGEDETSEKVQVMELLSRVAELQQSAGGSETEIEAILGKLQKIGGGEPLIGDDEEDAGNIDEEQSLADRLSALNLEELQDEELWELLNDKERESFARMMKDGTVAELVTPWKPWWEEHEGGRVLVEVLQDEFTKPVQEQDAKMETKNEKECTTVTKYKRLQEKKKSDKTSKSQNAPKISSKIPKLSSLCANPSPLVCYSVVNALYGYSFALRLFNGDPDSLIFEFSDMVLALSEALSSSRVFNSIQEALECGESLVLGGGFLDKDDPLAPSRAVEAVAHIMTGRSQKDVMGYCLAALQQLRSLLLKARSALGKDGEEGTRRHKFFLASKKCEFLQAWVVDNADQLHGAAMEVWSEHGRRESVRKTMEKEKTVVEGNLRKERQKGKMIEELS
ncbi:zinc finger HIT domain-containing protein 2 [Gouania willdenowi]|nr:zinc finger HIT domain-containing protein 2 [Gouania willdenowi]